MSIVLARFRWAIGQKELISARFPGFPSPETGPEDTEKPCLFVLEDLADRELTRLTPLAAKGSRIIVQLADSAGA